MHGTERQLDRRSAVRNAAFYRKCCIMLLCAFVEVQLSCWASWQEEGYWFIVAGTPASQLPHYVLVSTISSVAAFKFQFYLKF